MLLYFFLLADQIAGVAEWDGRSWVYSGSEKTLTLTLDEPHLSFMVSGASGGIHETVTQTGRISGLKQLKDLRRFVLAS